MWTLHSFLSILNSMLNPEASVLFKSSTNSYYSLLKTLIQWLPNGLRIKSKADHDLPGPPSSPPYSFTPHLAFCFNFLHLFSAPRTHQALYYLRDYASTVLSNFFPTPIQQPDSLSSYIQHIFQVQTFVPFKILFLTFLSSPVLCFLLVWQKSSNGILCNILQMCQLQLALVKGISHLPLLGLYPVMMLLLLLTSDMPWREFRVENMNEAMCLRKTGGTGLHINIFRNWFYEPNLFISSYLERASSLVAQW